eukprot:5924081-Amphidinium_carterae.1
MGWSGAHVAGLRASLASIGRPAANRAIGNEASDRLLNPKTRKSAAGTSWDCTLCGFFNFGYRTTCFACKQKRGNAKIKKTGGPSSKSGGPAFKAGGQDRLQ